MPRFLSFLALAFLVTGCELLDSEPAPTVVEGTVVDAHTERPVVGIQVLLSQGSSGFGIYPTRDRDRTDGEGRFNLSYTTESRSSLIVFVNDCAYGDSLSTCYDARYASLTEGVPSQEHSVVRYELAPIAP